MIPFIRAFQNLDYQKVTLVCGSQMGKSEAVLDVVGCQMDQQPAPTLYVGPSQDFITEELEPRLMAMINESTSLKEKLSKGKKNKLYRKLIGGVPVKLVWAGSATQLSATTTKLNIVDELDRMQDNVKGEGDPLSLVEARAFTFKDRKYGITSTPKMGHVEVEKCKKAGLEFWKQMPPEDIESPIWQLWQQGTMYHFAWSCPHCSDYFIPRFRNLKWPKDANATRAKRESWVECPNCKGHIHEHHKKAMNETGVYVAPGQSIQKDGTVVGEPPESINISFWVSGLCSPFVTFGERSAAYIEAFRSGNPEKLKAAINTGFGELYAPGGGSVPEWKEVSQLRTPYKRGTVPDGVAALTIGVDVQKSCLIYAIRGWGARASSWLIDHGELYGETHKEAVWVDLADLIYTPIDGHYIRRGLIDSGFRPGKKDNVPLNRVYDFCRNNARIISPAKGYATRSKPITVSKIEVNASGKQKKFGLELLLLDTDYFKSWLHTRIRWPENEPGAWLLPEDVTDDYCKQIVSEARLKKPSGQVSWVARSRDNHFLDCEALNVAAGELLNVYRIKQGVKSKRAVEESGVSEKELSKPTPKSWAEIAKRLNGM